MLGKCLVILLCVNVLEVEMARILSVIPVPSISHQIEMRALTQELARRGHEVIVITALPAFPKGKAPANLTEIDLQEVAYGIKKFVFAESATGKNDDIFQQIKAFFHLFYEIFEGELKTKEVQDIINDKNQHFDLLIIEACVTPALVFSHIFKAPLILFSSIGSFDMLSEYTGSATHPLLFPSCLHQKLNDLTLWDKFNEIYKHYWFERSISSVDVYGDEILRRNFGADVPPISELRKNVDMLFLSEYHIWDNNRPASPGTLYLGGIHHTRKPKKDLPKDVKTFLDSSKNGVIYMSFGTNVNSSYLPPHGPKAFVKVFSQLPYDVLVKWDSDDLPGASKNVKIMKWLPQSDLLHHPNVKLFIMQGGLQSTGDAINAGVPLLGMPMLGDQWFNVEQYVRLKIGYRLDMEKMNEHLLSNAIKTVIEDESYRRNMQGLRDKIQDQPQTPLERAVWWTEHVIRHKGARHLRAPTAAISYWDYFELDLVLMLGLCVILAISLFISAMYILIQIIRNFLSKEKID